MDRDNGKNDELRDDHLAQDEHRQDLRDEVFEETDGGVDDIGPQDQRRKEGRGHL
jgi:hypothetical protein